MTSARLTAPAASYVATRDFCKWYSSLALLWSERAIHTLPWFPPVGPVIIDSQPVLPYALTNFNTAGQELQEHWDFSCGDLTDTRGQNTITTIMKACAHQRFLDTCQCSCDAQARNTAVGFQTTPTRCTDSQICSASSPSDDNIAQCPMTLLEQSNSCALLNCLTKLLSHGCQYFLAFQSPMPDYCKALLDMNTLIFGQTASRDVIA